MSLAFSGSNLLLLPWTRYVHVNFQEFLFCALRFCCCCWILLLVEYSGKSEIKLIEPFFWTR